MPEIFAIEEEGMISPQVWDIINRTVQPYTRELTEAVEEILVNHPEVETEVLVAAWREYPQYQPLRLSELFANRGITEEVLMTYPGGLTTCLPRIESCGTMSRIWIRIYGGFVPPNPSHRPYPID